MPLCCTELSGRAAATGPGASPPMGAVAMQALDRLLRNDDAG